MKTILKNAVASTEMGHLKKFITLVISLHFVLASFLILFVAVYVVFFLPKGKVEPELLSLLKQILEYDFYIILSGLGYLTTENVFQLLLEKAKASQPPKEPT